jgi:hypothetical protein
MDCGDFHILFKSLFIIALPFNSITYAGSKERSSKSWEALALRVEFWDLFGMGHGYTSRTRLES